MAGIGVIPYFLAAAAGSLVSILPEHFADRGFWLPVNPDSRQLARVRATIDCIVARIEAEQDLFQSLPEG
jgi:DNA-binding transcriptional LysR family regulator